MGVVIGSQYEEDKATLKERIRKGTISALEGIAENHTCYFCKKHIDGKMWILNSLSSFKGKKAESICFMDELYFIDDACYGDSKTPEECPVEEVCLN